MTDALCRTIMHLTDERDTLAAELAALRVRHSDALKSFVAQTKIAVRAMAERDEARAEVLALREGTSKATAGETGSELHPRHSLPAAVESKVGTNETKDQP